MTDGAPPPDRPLRLRARLHLALLLALVMAPNLLWLAGPHLGTIWPSAVITPVALLLVLFALCGPRAWLACLLLLPFALLAPLEMYYIASYHRPTSPEVLATIFATNAREARGFFGAAVLPLATAATLSLAVAVLAIRACHRAGTGWRHRSRHYLLLLVLGTPLLGSVLLGALTPGPSADKVHKAKLLLGNLALPIGEGYPFGLAERLFVYGREWAQVRASVARLDSFRFHARRSPADAARGQRRIYVLVIGESSRIDRWQLFGYNRPTTPELLRTPHLVPITDMVAPWPMSVAAIPLLITRRPIAMNFLQPWPEASILRAMAEAGYDTWWISNQQPIGRFDSMVSVYAAEARHVLYLNRASNVGAGGYDEDLLAPLRAAIAGSRRDEFIVVHMMGSHTPYDLRYPRSFDRFRPDPQDAAGDVPDVIRKLDAYDNSIVYTDHVLATIIGIVRDSGAVAALLYSSDHGQNLVSPTCNAWGHGLGTRWDLRVPALFWYSGAWAAAYPHKLAALQANAGKRTLTADVFSTLVDLAGIDLPDPQPSHSLLSAAWTYRPRIVHGIAQMDFDDSDTDATSCDLVLPKRR